MTVRAIKVKGEQLSILAYADSAEKLITGSTTGETGTKGIIKVKGTYLHWVDDDGDERRKRGILTGATGTAGVIKGHGNQIYYIDKAGNERFVGQVVTTILRPNGVGDLTEFATQFPASGAHWDKLDEASHDGDTTYVADSSDTPDKDDLYTFEDLPAGIVTITKIRIDAYVTSSVSSNLFRTANLLLKTGGTIYETASFYHNVVAGFYKKEGQQYSTNPDTGLAWTVAEINALQGGIRIDGVHISPYATWRFTQLYITVTSE